MNRNVFTMKTLIDTFVIMLAFVGFLASGSNACATTMVSMNIAQLSDNAESAFVVQIQSVETSETNGRACDAITGIATDVFFGDLKTSEVVTWRQFKLGNTLSLPGMPQYEIGKEYLIFLSGPGTGMGFKSPVGLGQGAFSITRDPETGLASARNAYMNATLARGMNLEMAVSEIVASDAKGRNLSGEAQQQEIQRLTFQLNGSPNASLEALKKAARFFHSQKVKGRNVSQDYRSTTTLHLGNGLGRTKP